MNDAELLDHLTILNDTAAGAKERLRGVLDALTVIDHAIDQSVPDERKEEGHPERWSAVADESEALLRNAAQLLEDTAQEIRTSLEAETTTSPLKEAIVEVSVPDAAWEATDTD